MKRFIINIVLGLLTSLALYYIKGKYKKVDDDVVRKTSFLEELDRFFLWFFKLEVQLFFLLLAYLGLIVFLFLCEFFKG